LDLGFGFFRSALGFFLTMKPNPLHSGQPLPLQAEHLFPGLSLERGLLTGGIGVLLTK
jgi:hypothetical protein